ncbi:MAG: hypothetical protein AAGA21_24860 [Pseudomonadota bacterium]
MKTKLVLAATCMLIALEAPAHDQDVLLECDYLTGRHYYAASGAWEKDGWHERDSIRLLVSGDGFDIGGPVITGTVTQINDTPTFLVESRITTAMVTFLIDQGEVLYSYHRTGAGLGQVLQGGSLNRASCRRPD